MPVRSLNSSVLKWPRREEVEEALLSWVEKEKRKTLTSCVSVFLVPIILLSGEWGATWMWWWFYEDLLIPSGSGHDILIL